MDAGNKRPPPSGAGLTAAGIVAIAICAPLATAVAAPPPLILANDYDEADVDVSR